MARAASNAITAALMAAGGLDGVKHPLTGEDGMARVYLHGEFDPGRAVRDLGRVYEFDRLSIKPYPTCRLTHPAISAALELREQLGGTVAEIERVELVTGPQAHDVVGRDVPERRTPRTRVAAQFSVYWCVANALVHGQVAPRELAQEIPPTPKVRDMIARIHATPDASTARDIGGCIVRASGRFGVREVRHENAKGHPDFPLSDDELLAKFNANLSYAGVAARDAALLAEQILSIDTLPDVRVLADAVAGAVAG